MKKYFVLCSLLLLAALLPLHAQRFAYVDTEYILSKMPEYQSAQDQLNKLSEGWQAEVEGLMNEAEQLYKKYQAEKVMLSEAMQASIEDRFILGGSNKKRQVWLQLNPEPKNQPKPKAEEGKEGK